MNNDQQKEYVKRVNELLNLPVKKKLVTLKESTGFDAGELWQMSFEQECEKIKREMAKEIEDEIL